MTDPLKDWKTYMVKLPPDMVEWLESSEMAEFVSNDIGGEPMTPAEAIVHLLDMYLLPEVPRQESLPQSNGDKIPF